jgi:hypothetical protein
MNKYYARMMRARCPVDEASMSSMVPVLQHEIVPHALNDPGALQIFFFVDHDEENGTAEVFSLTLYESEANLKNAMKEASTEYRFKTLDALKCKAIDAKEFDVIAGDIKGNVSFA